MTTGRAICPTCGRPYQSLRELTGVYSLGLALIGICTRCGCQFGVNRLWRRSEIQHYQGCALESE